MRRPLYFGVLFFLASGSVEAQILWYEDFSLPNGTTVDNGSTAWSTNLAFDCSGSVTGSFDVQGGQFVGNETDCNARWESEWIDVSAYPSVDVYAVLDGIGSLDAGGGLPDTNKVGFRANGAAGVTWLDQYAGAQVINSISCGGTAVGADSIQIVVQMSTTGSDESHFLDDVTVSVSGDLPVGGGDTLFSRGNGDWDQTNTWSSTIGGASCGCTPNASSVVYVLCGDRVLLDSDADAKELHIEFGGRVDWDADNVELTIHDDGIVEVSVGARLFENGRGNAFLEFDGTGNHTLAVYSEDIGLEVDRIRVTENCSLTVIGNGRIDVEDDFELVANGATVINQFTNQLYIQDDLDLLGDDVVFHNDSGYLYIDGTLEILGERTEIINRDSIYVDLDFHGDNADDGTFENHGYIHCNDDVIMSNNSDDYRIDNFGFWRIEDDLRESGTGAVANEFHNRSGSYLELAHNSSELDWQLWANYDSNTVDYFRLGAQDYLFTPQDAYWNLTLSGTQRKRPRADLDINGTVRIEGTASFDVDDQNCDLTVAGDWVSTSNNALPFDYGAEQVTFDGNQRQRMRSNNLGGTFNDVVINKTDSLVLISPMNIRSNASITFTAGYVASDSLNPLVLNDGSTALSASDNSYVDGRVRKVGNDAFTFPIGDGGNYQPASISAPPGGMDAFMAQYFLVDPRTRWPYEAVDLSLHHVSTEEYWLIDNVGGGPGVSVTLAFDAFSGGVDNLDSLVVARWNGTTWTSEGNGGTTGTTAAGTLSSNGAITSFSPFTLGSVQNDFNVNPLPVELIAFQALRRGNDVELNWKTATEVSNDYFDIERSTDNQRWILVNSVQGAGTKSTPTDYIEWDYEAPKTELFYRLKQVDFDGTSTYSNTVFVPIAPVDEKQEVIFQTFPNPVERGQRLNLVFENLDGKDLLIVLRDMQGRELYMKTVYHASEDNYEVIEVSQTIPAGQYIITATSDNAIYNSKLMIR